MKQQQVNVDFWAMGKTMLIYGALSILFWVMLRLFNTVFSFPSRMRSQHENIKKTLEDLQKRFPDLNITEDDLKNAEKELEEFCKEHEENSELSNDDNSNTIKEGSKETETVETKKDL